VTKQAAERVTLAREVNVRHLQLRSIGLATIFGVLAGCSLFTEPNSRITDVAVARERWLASPPQDYTFTIGIIAFTPSTSYQVQVVGGTVIDARDATGKQVNNFTMTLATLWDSILSARARGDLVSASFDRNGVPIEAEAGDFALDSGVRYSVSNYHRSR
jgi:hypothetical protein